MESLYRSQMQHQFEILAISIDTRNPSGVLNYVDSFGFTFPVLLDDNFKINDLYRVPVVPTTILVDPEGRIVQRIPGAKDWNDPDLREKINRLVSLNKQ
jgi:peroxiredoxin